MHGSTAKAGWDENGMKMRQKWDKNGNDNGTFICYTIYYRKLCLDCFSASKSIKYLLFTEKVGATSPTFFQFPETLLKKKKIFV